MKTILFILCTLFAVCTFFSCKDEEVDNTTYLDNKLIEGEWYRLLGGDSTIYSFKENQFTEELYAEINDLDTLKYEGKTDHGNYRLTDTFILASNPVDMKLAYRLSGNNDSLYIHNPMNEPIISWFGFKRSKK